MQSSPTALKAAVPQTNPTKSHGDIDQCVLDDGLPADPVGFASTTPILTPSGLRAADDLCVGDLVTIRAGGSAKVRQVQKLTYTPDDLQAIPDAAPIRFDADVVPGVVCNDALLVSGNLAVVLPTPYDDFIAAQEQEFTAKALCDGGNIRRVIPSSGITYVQLTLDGAHHICASGLWVEAHASGTACQQVDLPLQWQAMFSHGFRPLR